MTTPVTAYFSMEDWSRLRDIDVFRLAWHSGGRHKICGANPIRKTYRARLTNVRTGGENQSSALNRFASCRW